MPYCVVKSCDTPIRSVHLIFRPQTIQYPLTRADIDVKVALRIAGTDPVGYSLVWIQVSITGRKLYDGQDASLVLIHVRVVDWRQGHGHVVVHVLDLDVYLRTNENVKLKINIGNSYVLQIMRCYINSELLY